MNNKFIYITDKDNHRIQVLNLENCTYSYQWGGHGKFSYPSEIRIYQDVCMLGIIHQYKDLQKMGNFFVVLVKLLL